MFRSTPSVGEGIPGPQSCDEKWDIIKMSTDLKTKTKNKNKMIKNTSLDDETSCSQIPGEGKAVNVADSSDEGSSKGKALNMQPRVILEETLLDTRVTVKARSALKPRKKEKEKETAMFRSVKPNAYSPPPSAVERMKMDVDMEEEEDRQEEDKQDSGTRDYSSAMESARDIGNLEDFSNYTENDSVASVRTTVSGASKRTKRIASRKAKKTRSRNDQQYRSCSSSAGEEYDSSFKEKRKRGRTITTGEGVEIRARRAARQELEDLKKEKQNLDRILHGGYDPSEYRGGQQSQRAEVVREEIQNLPSRDIAAQIAEAAKQVEEVASKSCNLKGGFVKILKEAVLQISLGTDALMCRSLPAENENAREMERLREEVRTLREEIEKIRMNKKDQEMMPPPQALQITGKEHMLVDAMEIEGETYSLPHTDPSKKKYPALRPALQGVRKNLSDNEEGESVPMSAPKLTLRERPPLRKNLQTEERDVRSILNEMFKELSSQISSQIKREVGTLLPTLMGMVSPLPSQEKSPDGARKNAPNTSAPKRNVEDRPVPAKRGKGEKGKGDKTSVNVIMPVEKKKPALPAETGKSTVESWSKVIGRKAKDKAGEGKATTSSGGTNKEVSKGPTKPSPLANTVKGKVENKKPPRRRVPRTAAVVLTCQNGQYAETMAEIRSKVKLSEVGIQSGLTTRTAVTGALVIEVPGAENGPKADALASRMREVLQNKEGIRISRPTRMAEIRIKGLECSISKEEILEAVAEKGKCRQDEVQIGEIRKMSENQGSLWLRLPLVAAKKAVEGGTIQIGWSKVKIALLEARPLRCHKCLEKGHVRERCPNPQDRSGQCYRCGAREHIAKECEVSPKCPLCTDLGRKADHILGSRQCTTERRRGKIGVTNSSSNKSALMQTKRGNDEEKEQPKPQRLPRNRGQSVPSTSTHAEEEMEIELLEEGREEKK